MRRKHILVVEDDRSLRQLYRTALLMAGFDVEIAEDGIGALRRIEARRPDLVVLDLHLPRVDGHTVLSELRANSETCNIPVVIVTGGDHERAVAEASAILRKPCEPEQLICVIERHIDVAA